MHFYVRLVLVRGQPWVSEHSSKPRSGLYLDAEADCNGVQGMEHKQVGVDAAVWLG